MKKKPGRTLSGVLKKAAKIANTGIALRPEILRCPQVPKPLHGVAPRIVLGTKWWGRTKREAYRSTFFRCLACGVHKSQARYHRWLEAHEVYEVDYRRGRMKYVETVPLCYLCHAYIHRGRLQMLLDRGMITHGRYSEVIQHGEAILKKAGLRLLPEVVGPFALWNKWRLVIGRKTYHGQFKDFDEWAEHFSEEGGER